MAIDRVGPADTGTEDDAIGDFDDLTDDAKEVGLSIGALFPTAGVGDIGCTFDGAADRAVVGTDEAVAGDADGLDATVFGFVVGMADLAAREFPTEAASSLGFDAGWAAKAELRSEVIRWYIRLGLVATRCEGVLALVAEDDLASAVSGTFPLSRDCVTEAGCWLEALEVAGELRRASAVFPPDRV